MVLLVPLSCSAYAASSVPPASDCYSGNGFPSGCLHAARPPPRAVRQVENFPAIVGCPSGECRDTVEVTYLGLSGFMIRQGTDVLLTGPSFTNPPLHRVLLPGLTTVADSQLVEQLLPPTADQAGATLVGHAQYDHLLDVPYIARKRARNATIYGSSTVRYILKGDAALNADIRVNAFGAPEIGNHQRVGTWRYMSPDSGMRFMALEAEHAPNFRLPLGLLRYTYARGNLKTDLPALPRTTRGWKQGESYAYVLDILDRDRTTPVFRIYFQDAASTPPSGFLPPFATEDQRSVDVALLCVGNFENVKDSPGAIIGATQPRFVMLGHWEGFFRQQTHSLGLIERTDASKLIGRVS